VPPIFLFLVFAVLLLGVIYAVWRYWKGLAHLSAEETEFDERMAALNERQANRISDEQLTHPVTQDDAWSIMVNRGRRTGRRRERYGGDLARRTRDRRRRS